MRTKPIILSMALLILASLACDFLPTPALTPDAATDEPTEPPPTDALGTGTDEPAPTDEPPPTEPPTTDEPPPTEPPTTELPPEPPAGLAIISFTVDVVDIPTGKRLTFNWETTGAVRATIWSGTAHRFPQAWAVDPSGTLTVDLDHTLYGNPSMTLVAYDAADASVSESVTIDWPCTYDYFFSPGPNACPVYEASLTWAAEQSFENGFVIWLEEIQISSSEAQQGVMLVFYADGSYAQYQDTWEEGDPESDPTIVPPAGLLQPIRGFGKLWRENTSVRDGLGWATAPEQGFDTAWQQRTQESIPGVAYVRTLSGEIIQIDGWGWESGGSWQVVTP